MHRAGRFLLSLAPPRRCVICDFDIGDPFCPGCEDDFAPVTTPRCARCAAPLAVVAACCGACMAAPPHFDAAHVLADYRMPIAAMVLALKSGARLDLGPAFARLLARRLAALPLAPAARVVPVPLAVERWRERGFNQALEIARPLARALARPLDGALLARIRHAPPQQSLDRAHRRANLDGAFATRARVNQADILLVDDVITTGATLDAAAATLRDAGARSIVAVAVARTP